MPALIWHSALHKLVIQALFESSDRLLSFPFPCGKHRRLDRRLHRLNSRGKMKAVSSDTMKCIFRCAAAVIIALWLAPLFCENRVFPWNNSYLHAHTVRAHTHGMGAIPSLVLWAWERPEDLRFLDPTKAGVAFLAGTVRLGPEGMSYRPRLQPLQLARETRLVAVVRIETAAGATLDHETARRVAGEIARAGRLPGVVAVQVDFDATTSQRSFYRELLVELRQQQPALTPISITALTSWCIGDRWMAGLPIDEATPMLFRMGVGQAEIANWMRSGHDFQEAVCRTSLGISIDEPWPKLPRGRRVYAFSPSAWTERSFENVVGELEAWQ